MESERKKWNAYKRKLTNDADENRGQLKTHDLKKANIHPVAWYYTEHYNYQFLRLTN